MKSVFLSACIALLSLTCTAADLSKPHAKDSATVRSISDQFVMWTVDYCKTVEEKQGRDFTSCFQRVTDMAISRLEQEQALQLDLGQQKGL